jgi:hypothetical protein
VVLYNAIRWLKCEEEIGMRKCRNSRKLIWMAMLVLVSASYNVSVIHADQDDANGRRVLFRQADQVTSFPATPDQIGVQTGTVTGRLNGVTVTHFKLDPNALIEGRIQSIGGTLFYNDSCQILFRVENDGTLIPDADFPMDPNAQLPEDDPLHLPAQYATASGPFVSTYTVLEVKGDGCPRIFAVGSVFTGQGQAITPFQNPTGNGSAFITVFAPDDDDDD